MIAEETFTVRAREFEPAYLRLSVGEIERRAREAVASLSSCQVCPRNRIARDAGSGAWTSADPATVLYGGEGGTVSKSWR